MGTLGSAFVAKLGDNTKANLARDAAAMSDDAWNTRLGEIEELASVKRDAKLDGEQGDGEKGEGDGAQAGAKDTLFTQDEVARAGAIGGGAPPHGAAGAEGAQPGGGGRGK